MCEREERERKIIQFNIEGERADFDPFHVDAKDDMREYTG
jgi:hypothetical protein